MERTLAYSYRDSSDGESIFKLVPNPAQIGLENAWIKNGYIHRETYTIPGEEIKCISWQLKITRQLSYGAT